MPVLAGLLIFAAAFSSPAPARDVHCPPQLGSTEIEGNLQVAAACRLEGTRIKGNVRIFAGGSLDADRVRIDGNVTARRAGTVTLLRSTVGGNVELQELVGDRSTIALSDIDGNVRLRDSRAALDFDDNRVNGNVDVRDNRGGVWIAGNFIDGNLSCRGNDPEPSGRDNRVGGSSQGQCRQLRPTQAGAPSPGEDEPEDVPMEPPPASEVEPVDEDPPSEDPPPESPPEPDEPPAPAPGGSSGDGSGPSGPTLDPQPSGGGGAIGPGSLLLLLALLRAPFLRRRFSAARVRAPHPMAVHGSGTRC